MASVKIERDTIRQGTTALSGTSSLGGTTLVGTPLPGTSGKHPIAEAVGTALTGGKEMAGVKGYLMVCSLPLHQDTRGGLQDQA